MSADKTNVMRSLDQKKIKYKVHEYKESGAVSGVEVAAALGQDPKRAFKTLVTIGKSGNHYVFMVPVAEELDLKKAAKCVGEKNIEMIKSKELLPLTGYIHGGCSPVGMKKFFRTVIDKSVLDIEDTIFFSAGKIGFQIETDYSELKKVIKIEEDDITVELEVCIWTRKSRSIWLAGMSLILKKMPSWPKMNLMLLNMCRQRLIRKILSRYIIFIIK